MNTRTRRPGALLLGQRAAVQRTMIAGGMLWIIFGYFRFMTPQGADVMWRDDLGHSQILSTELFALYNLPGVLALLLTTWAALSLVTALRTARSGLKLASVILLLLAAVLGLIAATGQLVLFDPLTTGGLNFGTLSLGLALFLAGLAVIRESKGLRERRRLSAGLMLLGVIGVTTLSLWPLIFALELLPLVVGTVAYALFGIGWFLLGISSAMNRSGESTASPS